MPRPVTNSMFIEPVLPSDVLLIANTLKPKSSYGYDDISIKSLKQRLDNIIQPITHIINRSFDTSIVPNETKIAKVVTAFSKLVEKLMFNKLISFLNSNNTLFI